MEKKKIYIIKIGGNIINDNLKLEQFISTFSSIQETKILVHGGGKIVNELAEKLEIKQEVINGRRITDLATLRLTTMVYAGLLNKQIVALLQSHNNNAIGLSGADGNVILAKKRAHAEYDYGYAGDVEANGVNTKFISLLIENNIVPVFCAITHNHSGQLLNTNADTIASELATALARDYEVHLNFCFENKGVLKDLDNQDSLITRMTARDYRKLQAEGIVSKGMIPKLDNAFNALENGVHTVVIAHADQLLNTIDKKEHAGTYLVA